MYVSPHARLLCATTVLFVCATLCLSGCSRTKYRLNADKQAYGAIAERNTDPRWQVDDYDIEIDPRSRYFDPYDPDRPPMPPDDPSSHQYMQRVNGIGGWKHWYDNGQRWDLENPDWRNALPRYTKVLDDGSVKLTLESSLKLAYIHSPAHQSQLETLYLSALDVTTERFRLQTQYFGGADAVYQHDGQLSPGGEQNTLTVGRGSGALPFPGGGSGSNVLQLNRRFATAGELMVGIANSFTWEFTQGDINFASSILNASIVQPLLRGAGKDVALEQLTIVERALLANLRAYHQYRQGFYTQVAIGELGVPGPQRRGGFFGGTGLTGFTGQGAGGFGGVGGSTFGGGGFTGGGGGGISGTGFAGGGAGTVGGYIGLLQQLQQIRNTEDSLNLQLRTLSLLEAHLDAGVIDLTQVDQFRQSIETEKATLLQTRNAYEFSLERFKTRTLGLPPSLSMELDDRLIRQFQLVAPEATKVQDSIAKMQDRIGNIPNGANLKSVRDALAVCHASVARIYGQLSNVKADIARMESAVPSRERTMVEAERKMFERDRKQLHEGLLGLGRDFNQAKVKLAALSDNLVETNKDATVGELVVWLGDAYRLVQGSILVQARARLEAITVESIDLSPDEAFYVALQNRLDFMNGRASLVDSWRLIAFNADALQANVSVALSGDLRTTHDNPLSFDKQNATARAGLQFDAPFTRLLERNNYRQSLIDYQRSRRGFIQAQDSLNLGLRSLLRQIEQLHSNLEIQRRAVAISIRRVDQTREELNRPVPPPLPGQPAVRFGPTAATSLLTALSDLRNTQNNFMSVWLNYYAARMRLARELGVMMLDYNGRWLDHAVANTPHGSSSNTDTSSQEELPLPPQIPTRWLEVVQQPSAPSTFKYDTRRPPLMRLPPVNSD